MAEHLSSGSLDIDLQQVDEIVVSPAENFFHRDGRDFLGTVCSPRLSQLQESPEAGFTKVLE